MPETANQKIYDAYVRRQIYMLQYAGGLRNKLAHALVDSERGVYEVVKKFLDKLDGQRILIGIKGRKWQREFETALSAARGPAWAEITKTAIQELGEFAISEAAAGATMIQGATPVALGMALPPAAQIVAIINSQPFQGKTLKQWLKDTERADAQRMLNHAKAGIVQGIHPRDVARSLIGTKEMKYADGKARISQRDLESVLLTVTNGLQNEAKQALYEANADIIKNEMFAATLDSRTTLICASNDGKTFKRGQGPIPPLHFRCRSLRIPYLKPENLGDRPFNPTTEKDLLRQYSEFASIGKVSARKNLPYGHKTKFDEFARDKRRELIGTVPAKTSYQDWLKQQSKIFQEEVLGPTRARMFRKGEISLEKFVARDGDILTLAQLKRKGFDV